MFVLDSDIVEQQIALSIRNTKHIMCRYLVLAYNDMSREQRVLTPQEYTSHIEFFYWLYSINVTYYQLERWRSLPNHIRNSQDSTVLLGLAHEDLVDGTVPRGALNQIPAGENSHVTSIVYSEGYDQRILGLSLRRLFSEPLTEIITINKKSEPTPEQISTAKQRALQNALLIFAQGTRDPYAPLQPGAAMLLNDVSDEQTATFFPYVALGMRPVLFPAQSSTPKNLLTLFTRAVNRSRRDVHFLAGEPLIDDFLRNYRNPNKMTTNAGKLTRELERIRIELLSELAVTQGFPASKYPEIMHEIEEYSRTGKLVRKRGNQQ